MNRGGDAARADLRGGVGWMALGTLILAAAWRMDRFETMGGTPYTAPGLVPGLFGAALLALGALLAARGWRERRAGAAPLEPLLNGRLLLMLMLTFAYAAGLVGRVPFAPATALFVALFTGLYADTPRWPRRLAVALAAGLLTTLAVVLVFERLFLVRLP